MAAGDEFRSVVGDDDDGHAGFRLFAQDVEDLGFGADFEFSYYSAIDDALLAGLGQNQEFFSHLLNNDDVKKQLMGLFSRDIYQNLRGDGQS